MTTSTLKNIKKSNGLKKVSVEEMKKGDLLVYGYYDSKGKWHGHVVVVVYESYSAGGFQGLTVGSHGGGAGVRFITYRGFPHYYRKENVKLYNVLRAIQ